MKILKHFYKLLCSLIITADSGNTDLLFRAWHFIKSLAHFAPIAFVLGAFKIWYVDNVLFTNGIMIIVFLNMAFGGYMHFKMGDFKWGVFLSKTLIMIVVISLTYFVLEIALQIAGNGVVVTGFRSVLQIATVLYPGSKILKNVFILSKGEHPPKWLMEKVYNFNSNGDLKTFLDNGKSE